MGVDSKTNMRDARTYTSNHKVYESRIYKGKILDMRCDHCIGIRYLKIGHTKDRCQVLHPELKPKFNKDGKGFFQATPGPAYKGSHVANLAATSSTNHTVQTHTSGMLDFTSNPTTLINDFASYLQHKNWKGQSEDPVLGKFVGFLVEVDNITHEDSLGILNAFSTALNNNLVHGC